jgi:hypothetical protein
MVRRTFRQPDETECIAAAFPNQESEDTALDPVGDEVEL